MNRPDDSNDPLSDPAVAAALAEYQAELDAGRSPDRASFLRKHAAIADALDGCLRAVEFVHGAVHRPKSAAPPDRATDLRAGGAVGDFRILREVGRGGMGVVFEATQLSLGRRVALKVLPTASALDDRALARFRHEAQAAATLQHPHIVPVFAVGAEAGVHYFAMQFIDGQSLADVVTTLRSRDAAATPADTSDATAAHVPTDTFPAAPQTPAQPAVAPLTFAVAAHTPEYFREVARLVAQAADALQHAHEVGVVHRDIKPGNLLLDARGEIWVADFGLAKLPGSDLTGTADVMGTMRFMSPEQASGRAVALDGRADVYSLGVTLYELLTLTPAFAAADRRVLLRQVLEEEPTPPRKQERRVPADLETITLKAMAKEPGERYQTAGELAADLRRFLDHRPIEAKPPTPLQRVRKWVRRNRVLVTVAAAVGLAGLVTTVGVLIASNETISRKQKETQGALDAEAVARGDARERLRQSLIDQAAAVRLTQQPGQRLKSLALLREAAAIRPSEELRHDVMASYLLTDWEEVEPTPAATDQYPGSFFSYLDADANKSGVLRHKTDPALVERVSFRTSSLRDRALSPCGRYVVMYDQQQQGLVWDRTRQQVVARVSCRENRADAFGWSADSSLFVSEGDRNRLHVYDTRTGTEVGSWEADPKHEVMRVSVHPNGQWVAVGFGQSGPGVRLFEFPSGRPLGDLSVTSTVTDLLWSPSGYWLAAATNDGFVTLWRRSGLPADLPNRYGTVVVGGSFTVGLNAFSPAEDLLLVNARPRTLTLVSTHGRSVVTRYSPRSVPSHTIGEAGILGLGRPNVVFGSDGRSIGRSGQVQYRVVQPLEVRRLARYLVSGWRVAIGDDGRTCYVMGGVKQTSVSLWALDEIRPLGSTELPNTYRTVLAPTRSLWSYDAKTRAVSLREPKVVDRQVVGATDSAVFTRLPEGVRLTVNPQTFQVWSKHGVVVARAFAPSPSAAAKLTAFEEDDRRRRQLRPTALPGLYCWPPDAPAKVRFLDFGVVESYVLDPTGRSIATQQAGEDLIKIWAYPSGQLVRSFPSTPSDQLQFSPDGRFLAQSDHGDVAVWQVETGARIFEQTRLPQSRPSAVAFSGDGKLFAVGDEEDVVIRRTADAAVCLRWSSPGALTTLAFGPDGRRLVGAAAEGVWVWDLDLIRRQLRELNLDWSDDPPTGGGGSAAE